MTGHDGFDVVVTGIGVVSPIGTTRREFWANLVSGKTGLGPAQGFAHDAFAGLPVGVVALDASRSQDRCDATEPLHRAELMLVASMREARDQSGLVAAEYDPDRIGVYVGSCAGTLHARVTPRGIEFGEIAHVSGRRPLEALAGVAAAAVGAQGPRVVVNTACAGGARAIGVAAEHILAGDVDVAFAGGVDELHPISLAGFRSIGALDLQPCSPYGRSAGLNLGEGAAVLVLERRSEVTRRGGVVIASLLGSGFSADAYHPTAPDPLGYGAELAVRRALADAARPASDVDYVCGHGTGTAANDSMERALLVKVFGAGGRRVPVSSLKSATGHALAGSAAMEAAASVIAVASGVVPPTVGHPGDDALDVVPGVGRPVRVDVAATMSYAFGGNNACLVFGKHGPGNRRASIDVVVTGLGAVGGHGVGRQAWFDAFLDGGVALQPAAVLGIDRDVLCSSTPALERCSATERRHWRRMDALARSCVTAAQLALDDADAADLVGDDDVALIVGTQTGPYDTAMQLHREIRQHRSSINPMLFANAALSSTAGHVCSTFRWHGPTVTLTSGWSSGLQAVLYGARLVGAGRARAALVLASDVLNPEAAQDLAMLGAVTSRQARPFDRDASGCGVGGAAVAVLLERAGDAESRGRRAYARIRGGAMSGRADAARELPVHAGDWERCVTTALTRTALAQEDCSLVVAAAGGIPAVDAAEARGLANALPHGPYVIAPKGQVGECRAAGGLIGVLAGIHAMKRSTVVPVAGLENPIEMGPLRLALGARISARIDTCLVDSASPGGTYACVVIDRY